MSKFKKLLGSKNGHELLKNMAILVAGAGSAQIIGLASIPFITRIYGPADMGLLSAFLSLTLIVAPLLTLRYSVALPLPKTDRMAANILAATLLTSVAGILIITLALGIWSEPLLKFFNMEALAPFWWLLCMSIFATSLYETLSFWATRKKHFVAIARTKFTQTLSGSLTKILLGLLSIKPLGLLAGQIVQQGGGLLSLGSSAFPNLKKNRKYVKKKRALLALRHYSDIPTYRLPSQLLLMLSIQGPALFFSYKFGPAETGQLGLALTALAIPINLLGTTAGNAYFAEISKIGKRDPARILSLTTRVAAMMSAIAVLPCLVLAAAGPQLFELVFGSSWHDAGMFSRYLSIYLFVQFVAAPLVNVFTVFSEQKKFFFINLTRASLMCLGFYVSDVLDLAPKEVVIIYSATLTAHYSLVIFSIFHTIKSKK